MKISDMINQLKSFQDKFGDKEVLLDNSITEAFQEDAELGQYPIFGIQYDKGNPTIYILPGNLIQQVRGDL